MSIEMSKIVLNDIMGEKNFHLKLNSVLNRFIARVEIVNVLLCPGKFFDALE